MDHSKAGYWVAFQKPAKCLETPYTLTLTWSQPCADVSKATLDPVWPLPLKRRSNG